MEGRFHNKLKGNIHKFIMGVYDATENFPKSEMYGTKSQLERASVSIMLNYVEGFARDKPKVKLNFYDISYGSARECKYAIFLAKERKWIEHYVYESLFKDIDEVCAMLWSMLEGLRKKIER